jgi:hypothetical protein
MPVFIRTERGDLRLTASNCGAVLDTQLAATPQDADRVAIMMLASRDVLDIRGCLICLHADGDNPHGHGLFDVLPPLID